MFASEQIRLLADSGWNTCDSVREGIEKAGLPVPTATYLKKAFTAAQWERAHRATIALSAHFASARFAHAATFGVLLVPDKVRFRLGNLNRGIAVVRVCPALVIG